MQVEVQVGKEDRLVGTRVGMSRQGKILVREKVCKEESSKLMGILSSPSRPRLSYLYVPPGQRPYVFKGSLSIYMTKKQTALLPVRYQQSSSRNVPPPAREERSEVRVNH